VARVHEGRYADIRETHCAVVVFLGDRAYKLKKPVDLGFLDFRTRAARERACRRELELNRRFAPDVYLDTLDVVGPDGAPCDHLLVMRRMPEARRLATLVVEGVDVDDDLRRLARLLAVSHAAAETGPEIATEGRPTALRDRWTANIAAVRSHAIVAADVVAESEYLALRYIAGREPLLEYRADNGLIRDGHGDLLAEDVFCLPDGPRALDCLDFSDRLRWMDVLDDAACLAMDLERLGAPRLAASFMRWYEEFSGIPQPVSLEHHYIAYRAFMRAKVAGVRAGQGVPTEVPVAQRLADISLRHLRAARVRLVLVGGAPGTGKSTLAEALSDRIGATLLRADRVRKEVVGIDPRTHAPAEPGQGIYDRATTNRTYDELLRRAEQALAMGESVVLDASFASAEHRVAAEALARRASADFAALRCAAPIDVLRHRLAARHRVPAAWSDADERIGVRLAREAEKWPSGAEIDTAGSAEKAVEQATTVLGLEPLSHWPRRPQMAPD